jgi:uncharacterized protein YcbK (DUF882 family)
MMPILTLAMALVSGALDLAHLFVPAAQEKAPVSFYFGNRHEEQTFELFDDTGLVKSEIIKPFSYFVRCWRTNKVKPMHSRTMEIVAAVSRHFGNARIEIVSAYRAKPYGAPHSKHFIGRAMDIRVPGVPARQVATWIWKSFRHVGVGLYPNQEFVHVDSREDDVRWLDYSRSGESAGARYFGRPATEELQPDAPRLAYDAVRTARDIAVALR